MQDSRDDDKRYVKALEKIILDAGLKLPDIWGNLIMPKPEDSLPNIIYVTGASARRVLHHRNQQKGGRYELHKVEGGYALWNASFKCWEAKR